MDMNTLMRRAQEVQGKIAKVKEKIESMEFSADVADGAVKATVDGNRVVKSVQWNDEIAEDKEMLQDLIVAAINKAGDKADETMQTEMEAATGGMNIPGM